ncbi:YlbF family regulator [Ignavigranum ruoffiae]|uniref:YlbF family regulator n=1 Tax=Ignavigranum ruoffiae TaxID=89093 RepID=UPI0024AE18EC|nr:YlbF family regulator [Ignavigranum ruoffiae]
MNNNIYDTANQLERDLRNLESYQALKEIMAEIHNNAQSADLFSDYRKQTQAYQQKILKAEQVTEEELAQLQDLTDKVKKDPLINKLMQEEQRVSQVIHDIYGMINRPLEELYRFDS